MHWLTRLMCLAFAVLVMTPAVSRADVYHVLDVADLDLDREARQRLAQQRWMFRTSALVPRVALDGPGQVYLQDAVRETAVRPGDDPQINEARIAVRLPEPRDVTGTLFVPADEGGERRFAFSIDADAFEDRPGEDYYRAVAAHYRRLLDRWNIEGRAWFRSQLHEAERMLEGEPADAQPARPRPGARVNDQGLPGTFEMFSGTRAAGENLDLDTLLNPRQDALVADVDLAEVEGITVDPIDWDELLAEEDVPLDATAAYVPGDQLAVFFPDVTAMQQAMAEFAERGTQVVRFAVGGGDDTQQRYERQLGVSVDDLADAADGEDVRVTLTAGDPYIMAGTDLALLMESEEPEQLHQDLQAVQQQAAQDAGAAVESQTVGGLEAAVVRSDDRTVSSYLARMDELVVLANSPVQLERIAAAANGEHPSLADQPEYEYFRQRYAMEDAQTLLLVLSDEAIRKWGSPAFRIAASRRARMLTGMIEARARHLDELLSGEVQPRALELRLAVPESGELRLTEDGIRSEVYGRPEFLTPINELDVTHASEAEVEAYRRWRARYEQRWRQVFDPIALRLTMEPTQLAGDLTVLPLAEGSEYRRFLEAVGEARITAEGPIYEGALAHFAMAIDLESEPLVDLRNFARQGLAGINNPFGWLGETVGGYVDESTFWSELAEAEDADQFVEEQGYAFPIALYAEVGDRVQLASFLTGVRTMAQSTAPGLVRWVNREHEGREYVAVVSAEEAGVGGLAIYYAIHRGTLLLTPSEQTLHRFIESEDEDDADAEPAQPWLADHVNVQVSRAAAKLWQRVGAAVPDFGGGALQQQGWAYLPVLNDLRQHFPDHDPVAAYVRLTDEQPVDLYGGSFAWSQDDQTMQSTAVGHPGDPKAPDELPIVFRRFDFANFGLDFDATHDALRARMLIDRRPR